MPFLYNHLLIFYPDQQSKTCLLNKVFDFCLSAGSRSRPVLRGGLHDPQLRQLPRLPGGQVCHDPRCDHHLRCRGDVLFRPAGMLCHPQRVQSRPQLGTCWELLLWIMNVCMCVCMLFKNSIRILCSQPKMYTLTRLQMLWINGDYDLL